MTWYRLPKTSPVCPLAGIIKELKGGGGELTARGAFGGLFDGMKYSQTWSCRVRVTQLWFCVVVGCGNCFELLKDRNCKPRVRVVDSIYLTLPSLTDIMSLLHALALCSHRCW